MLNATFKLKSIETFLFSYLFEKWNNIIIIIIIIMIIVMIIKCRSPQQRSIRCAGIWTFSENIQPSLVFGLSSNSYPLYTKHSYMSNMQCMTMHTDDCVICFCFFLHPFVERNFVGLLRFGYKFSFVLLKKLFVTSYMWWCTGQCQSGTDAQRLDSIQYIHAFRFPNGAEQSIAWHNLIKSINMIFGFISRCSYTYISPNFKHLNAVIHPSHSMISKTFFYLFYDSYNFRMELDVCFWFCVTLSGFLNFLLSVGFRLL